MSKKANEKILSKVGLDYPAIGLESEFTLYVDDKKKKPEKIFGSPKAFLAEDAMHRVGSSYHIPTGGAVYFDSGVIEVATPVIEIEKGCATRAGRSLWESIHILRDELDKWEVKTDKKLRLEGFSSHYNVSFDLPEEERKEYRTEKKFAKLLAYILPVPLMLLIGNRMSTGIGVRPRGNRIEITADFVPSPSLMIAAATLITGVVREAMKWKSYELGMVEQMKLPVIKGYKPGKHTSRKGWLAKDKNYPANPFTCDIDEKVWDVTHFEDKLSLRQLANAIYLRFAEPVEEVSGPYSSKLIASILSGKAPSLLDLDDRPKEYEDVGKLCAWNNLFPVKQISRSKYERVLISSILKRKLKIDGETYTPDGMKGWAEVVFVKRSNKSRQALHIDVLKNYIDNWEKNKMNLSA
ncbi:MAG: hypothetical protein ABFS32_19365 [Bacteroidota bacterium]